MYEYEKRLQEDLLRVFEAHKPVTHFEFGIYLGYMHAIARATVSGRCDELEDKLFEKTQEYRSIARKD